MNEAEKFLQEHLAKAQRPQPSAPQVQTTPFASGAQNDSAAVVGKQQMVSMGEAFKRFWVNWSLNGRSSRSEFWFAVFANFILGFLIGIVIAVIGVIVPPLAEVADILFSLLILWPSIAIVVRRLHDIGKSGWWYWISLIPFVGWLIHLIFMCRASEPYENRYGPVPNVR